MEKPFDVVIIGAGLGGLVSANYLAKAGLRVLLLEQHSLPGGCCSSFERKSFIFESGAHSLGSCREDGLFSQIFEELDLHGSSGILVRRAVPSDSVITQDFTLSIRDTLSDNIEELSSIFPAERNRIKKFLNEIDGCDVRATKSLLTYINRYQKITFRKMLDEYFDDERLKQVFCVFLGNVGLPSTDVNALRAIVMFREFILDGGYYVVGGMHKLVDRLASEFVSRGGTLRYQARVIGIHLDDHGVNGVSVSTGEQYNTRVVISNTSPSQTFSSLLEDHTTQFGSEIDKYKSKIQGLLPSVSAVVIYLGLKRQLDEMGHGRTVWYMPAYDADQVYADVLHGKPDLACRTFLAAFPARFDESLAPDGFECVNIFALAPFMDEQFWKHSKVKLTEALIKRAGNLIPNLQQRIVLQETATPITIQRYTLNDKGAMYGLASTMSQMDAKVMPQKSIIPGLYFASHWSTIGTGQGGTPMAAFAGRNAARLALRALR